MRRLTLPGSLPGGSTFTTSGVALDEVTALLDLLATVQGVDFYDGHVADESGEDIADPPMPYGVLYADLGIRSRTTLAPISDRALIRAQTTLVGASAAQVRWAQVQTRAVLTDAVLVVSGRSLFPLTLVDSQPVRRDDDTKPNPPVFFGVDVYAIQSVAARS